MSKIIEIALKTAKNPAIKKRIENTKKNTEKQA